VVLIKFKEVVNMPRGKVREVIDGDTLILKGGDRIRLENVDAPEIGTKGAAKARHQLENLVEGKTITYNEVGTSYGRIVAKVKVAGKSVNQAMRRKGY
jgi:micrococcal nuclease